RRRGPRAARGRGRGAPGRPGAAASPGERPGGPSSARDLEDLQRDLAGRRRDLDDVADLVPEEALPDRARDRDLALRHVRLLGRDEGVGSLLLRLPVPDADRREDVDPGIVDLPLVHEAGAGDGFFELRDAGLVVALRLLRGVVLGVLGEVTLGAGLGDGFGDLLTAFGLGEAKLFLQLREGFLGEINRLAHE